MSDHNERAFLKDKFKNFDAVSSDATKSTVMSKIQTKSRRKRFIMLFFLTAFGIAISALTILYLINENMINRTVITKNSENLNDKIIDSSIAKTDLNKVENQGTTYENFSNDKGEFKETQSDVKPLNLKSVKLSSGKNRLTSQNNLADNKSNEDMAVAFREKLLKEKSSQVTTDNKQQYNRLERSNTKNNSSVNRLSIKPILLFDFTKEYHKLMNTASNTSSFKKSRWIIGIAFSYNNLRSAKLKNQISQNAIQAPIPNNNPDEFSTNQNLFEVSRIMNLDISVIRKLNNRFYFASGVRYSNLYSLNENEKIQDHLVGIPLKIAYHVPFKNRWAFDLSSGVNYNLSILKSDENTNKTSSNFANFQLSTAELNVGLSYFINEKLSIKLSPQFNYLLYMKEQNTTRNFQKSYWFGGQFGLYFQLD